MVDKTISMNVNDILELEYLIEEMSSNVVSFNKNPSGNSSSYISSNKFVFNPDGTGVYELEINNQTIEIDVYDIPDSAVAQWDARKISASDGDTVSTWSDQTSNGYDLTNGTATYQSSTINGYPGVVFDGADDEYDIDGSLNISQRLVVFAVADYDGSSSNGPSIAWDSVNGYGGPYYNGFGNGEYGMFAGTAFSTGDSETSATQSTADFNGSSSTIRIRRNESTSETSGDAGTNSIAFDTVGSRGGSDFWNGPISFIEIHDGEPSNGLQTREQEIRDAFGIA